MRAPQSPAFVATDTPLERLQGTAADPWLQQDGVASVLAWEMLAEENTTSADLRSAGSFASACDTKNDKTEMSDKIDSNSNSTQFRFIHDRAVFKRLSKKQNQSNYSDQSQQKQTTR